MQSKKRFIETNLYESEWFMELNPEQKVFWHYLNARCDNVGVWEPNWKLAFFSLGLEGNYEEFSHALMKAVNKSCQRIIVLENGYWFLSEFVRFQYCNGKPLSSRSPAHISYLNLIEKRNLWEWFCKNQPDVMPPEELDTFNDLYPKPTLSVGYQKGSDRYKDQEEDKETDTDTDKETPSEIDLNNTNPLTGEALTDEGYPESWDTPVNNSLTDKHT